MAENATFKVEADTEAFEASLRHLKDLSASFGSQLAGALKTAAVSGRSLDDVLRRIALNLAGMALSRGLQPLQNLAGSLFSSLFGGGLLGFARGGVVPFASGGVVSSPTYFPLGGRMGVMGEAGAEAILPLQRSSDGRLGVAGGGRASALNVVFNVSTADATSFRKSEAQLTAMLARAVGRGSRGL